jgi:hypothetical protein
MVVAVVRHAVALVSTSEGSETPRHEVVLVIDLDRITFQQARDRKPPKTPKSTGPTGALVVSTGEGS